LFVSSRVDLGETDAEVGQHHVFLRRIEPVGDAGRVEHAPEAVARMGVVVARVAGGERRVVPAEKEIQARSKEIPGA
jgi:hypothetical protein